MREYHIYSYNHVENELNSSLRLDWPFPFYQFITIHSTDHVGGTGAFDSFCYFRQFIIFGSTGRRE